MADETKAPMGTDTDPGAYTVPEVNDYLGTEKDDDGKRITTVTADEYQRVMDAERAGKARSTILEGPHAPVHVVDKLEAEQAAEEAAADPEAPEKDLEAMRVEQQRQEAEQGYLGEIAGPEDEHAVHTVEESAPEVIPEVGAVSSAELPDFDNRPATIAEQVAPDAEGEEYVQGYVGYVPSRNAGTDLTLPAVLERQRAEQAARDEERLEASTDGR